MKVGQQLPLALSMKHNWQQRLCTVSVARQRLQGVKPSIAAARL